MIYDGIYRNKRVLVTGHTGFKGAWLTFILNQLGAEVCGFSLPTDDSPNHFNMLNISSEIKHIMGDVREGAVLDDVFQSFKPEFVFHLAAQALVKQSYIDPVGTCCTNIMGSINLLDAVRKCQAVRSLVYITSDKCYENSEWIWGYRENDRLGGHDPYSASKAAAEVVFSAYAHSYFSKRENLGAATTRAGNVIGGGDWAANRIIPDCIRAISCGTPIKIRKPNATRPWQHVLDPLSGYLALGSALYKDSEGFNGSWNFGPHTHEVKTVHEVATSFVNYIGRGVIDVDCNGDLVHEANLLQLNCDKARNILGWTPRWGVDKAIYMTAAWYKSYLNGGDIRQTTLSHIHEYYGGAL
jgi:CDP-glucose 4,6-dehydratase